MGRAFSADFLWYRGAYPAADAQRPENLAATIYHALGIPPTASWKDELDRPHQIYFGEPIRFA